jgi:hypothetical protein
MRMQPRSAGTSKTNHRWYPNKVHRKFYRLLAGKLVSCPMQADGAIDEAEMLEVDFDATQFEPPVDSKYVTLADELQVVKQELQTMD